MDIQITPALPKQSQHWNKLQPDNSPFLHHAFLQGLALTHCIGTETGWDPKYISIYDGDALVALAPMYSKQHSQGEYVFDHQWAQFAHENGIHYYPKLVVAIPFTPCTGQRILHNPGYSLDQICDSLLPFLKRYAAEQGQSSIHVLFQTEAEARCLEQHGFFTRTGTQFHWQNHGFASFDDFLASLTSRKRKSIRKERQQLAARGLEIVQLTGKDITKADMQAMIGFYQNTHLHKWGHPYLTDDFFYYLLAHFSEHLLLVLAKQNDLSIAGSLFLKKGHTLYGRYWGSRQFVDFLHFELSYYQAIDYCIAEGLSIFEAGAQGEHKLLRGFEPVTTYSSHYVVHPGLHQALSQYCNQERVMIENNKTYLESIAPNKALKAKTGGQE